MLTGPTGAPFVLLLVVLGLAVPLDFDREPRPECAEAGNHTDSDCQLCRLCGGRVRFLGAVGSPA